jgi:hypothetical protein
VVGRDEVSAERALERHVHRPRHAPRVERVLARRVRHGPPDARRLDGSDGPRGGEGGACGLRGVVDAHLLGADGAERRPGGHVRCGARRGVERAERRGGLRGLLDALGRRLRGALQNCGQEGALRQARACVLCGRWMGGWLRACICG